MHMQGAPATSRLVPLKHRCKDYELAKSGSPVGYVRLVLLGYFKHLNLNVLS